jgi:AraC-like DNA-binding protein
MTRSDGHSGGHSGGQGGGHGHGEDWARYWRSPDRPLEAMYAHFRRHTYHRHSHETYSFGVTESGAQAFTCRGAEHTSAAGMVMAFNPDDPHDGWAATEGGFTYRMVHIAPSLVADVLSDAAGRTAGLPLFAEPVRHDPVLASALRRLHAALVGGAGALEQDELLAAAVAALAGRGATRPWAAAGTGARAAGARGLVLPAARLTTPAQARIARDVRATLDDAFTEDLGAADLAAVAGCSRYAVYRAFEAAYGLAPSDYQRLRRLRAARQLLASGRPAAEVASEVGFADQSHLNRWFTRYFGVTPGAYSRAAGGGR